MPASMSTTPTICSTLSASARPVFNFISAISVLNCSARSLAWLIVLRPSVAQIGGRQLGFHRGRCPERRDPATEHDPHPVGDAQNGTRELLDHDDRDALLGDLRDDLVQLL